MTDQRSSEARKAHPNLDDCDAGTCKTCILYGPRPNEAPPRCEECNAEGGPKGELLSQFITEDRWRCYDRSACLRRMMPRTEPASPEPDPVKAFDDWWAQRPKGVDHVERVEAQRRESAVPERGPCTLLGCERMAEHCYVHSAEFSSAAEELIAEAYGIEEGAAPDRTAGQAILQIRALLTVAEAAGELVRANDEALGLNRPRPDIAWRNLKTAVSALSSGETTNETTVVRGKE